MYSFDDKRLAREVTPSLPAVTLCSSKAGAAVPTSAFACAGRGKSVAAPSATEAESSSLRRSGAAAGVLARVTRRMGLTPEALVTEAVACMAEDTDVKRRDVFEAVENRACTRTRFFVR